MTAAATTEDSGPSAAVARFTSAEAGNPDVGVVRLDVRAIGHVSLPQGRLAVSDAFINDVPILVSKLPPGDYPVELLMAKSHRDERVAAARLRVRNEAVANWQRVGFIAVDSGTGALFDPRVSSRVTSATVGRFNENLLNALDATRRTTYAIAAMSWEDMSFLAFSTGFGDGIYPVYVGSSAAGLPAAVLLDFEMLPRTQ